MEKSRLDYATYFSEYLVNSGKVGEKVLKYTNDKGLFEIPHDSEIFVLRRNPKGLSDISAYIMRVMKVNNEFYNCAAYIQGTRENDFFPKTKDIYLKFIESEGDIYPIIRSSRYQYNIQKEQKLHLESLLKLYLEANPEPNTRLAVINSVGQYSVSTLGLFLSITKDLCEPGYEIKVPAHKEERLGEKVKAKEAC